MVPSVLVYYMSWFAGLVNLSQENHAGGVVAVGCGCFQFDVEGCSGLEGIQRETVCGRLATGLDCLVGRDFRHQFLALPQLQRAKQFGESPRKTKAVPGERTAFSVMVCGWEISLPTGCS